MAALPLPQGRRPALILRGLAAQDREIAGAHWRVVETRLEKPGLTCSWAWTETWLRHFGDLVEHRFVLAENTGGPCAAALLTRGRAARRGPGIRRLHIGTAGEPPEHTVYVEPNRLLVAPDLRRAFAAALLADAHRDSWWDELCLDGFAAEDAEALLAAEPALVARREASPSLVLPAVGTDVLQSLSSGAARRIRRSLRGLEPVRTEWAATQEHALDILEELARLHEERWARSGRRGAFASHRFAAFHRDLVRELLPRDGVVLFRAHIEQGTLGCLYGFVEHQRLLFYQSGFIHLDDNRLRPGLTCHALLMQACADRGLREYDLLAGDDRYKRELTTTQHQLVWARARRRRPRTLAAAWVSRARRWARTR